ncbi:hypothetical protein CWE08_03880 [Aliidiomarina iranensis]|uniref:Competence protein ComEA n=1 Tax=Aliidiomarina iranensis TaxID=1434071 RepID=A0A432W034_9GAMM|nr:helix-hairpin-helix domain-containing protein [Aliidiomarina iranensis]RUO22332.1 hypothetical protein CWE08_03880 [Aliidiomarina iranensis]
MLIKSLIAIACSGAFLFSAEASDSSSSSTSIHKIDTFAQYSAVQEERESQTQKVNINRASAEELAAALRGVGMARARAIIKLREEIGQFTDVEQLLQVRGLGVKVLNDNREKISL